MKCPKCGEEIKRFDLSPNCKKCGVHIMYYTQEQDLSLDAKKTELEFTSARILVAKIKAAYISGKIPVMRLVFILLSVASLLLPHFDLSLSFPWWNYKLSVSALGIYNVIADSFWKIIPSLGNTGVAESLYVIVLSTFAMLLLAVLSVAVCLVIWLLSFINIKKTAKLMAAFSVLGIISQLTGTGLSFIAVNLSGAYEFISVKPLFGGILSAVLIGVFFVTNILLVLRTPEIFISDADKKRLEIKEKLRRGEITFDDLPLPIVEEEKTEEDKKKKKRGKKK